jgi:hypothetical protein
MNDFSKLLRTGNDFNRMTKRPDSPITKRPDSPITETRFPLTCKHKPRISKINGEWHVFDGYGYYHSPNEQQSISFSTFDSAVNYVVACLESHRTMMRKGECSGHA